MLPIFGTVYAQQKETITENSEVNWGKSQTWKTKNVILELESHLSVSIK